MYDLIIIGAGPAGITAAVYAARKAMKFLVISRDIGGQAALSGDVENYTGYQFVTGPELAAKFEEHMKHFQVEMKEGEDVLEVKKVHNIIEVKTAKGVYESRTLIIASGRRPRLLNIPGEQEFKNRGVTYCATCDAPLFSGREVAVIGGGNSALDATLQLMQIAGKIYLIDVNPELGGDSVMRSKIEKSEKVTVINGAQTREILGDKMVTGLVVSRDGKEEKISVQGIFIEIGSVPESDFASGVAKNEFGEIVINNSNETNFPGIFAAGDVTDVPGKQIIIAAGEGSKALLSVFKYIAKEK
ncbi:MAG: FAD-dependent oxidoreductase [Nitrospirae bacterium]|nr:FAD-dependent oxidoreductase [Nitrospirota bacterium]